MERYDTDRILDKCRCGGWPMWLWDQKRRKDGEPAWRGKCAECAEITDWQSAQWEVMIAWNKAQRNH
jgi:hypothetical protein